MALEHLAVYLQDHFSGATAALELLAELERLLPGRWKALREEIDADRQELEHLIRQIDRKPSTVRQTAAWVTEKLAEMKTRFDDPAGGPLRRLELIEALSLGIEGKRALWTALQSASQTEPTLLALNYDRLIARAEQQRQTAEERRLQAARDIISANS